MRTSATLLMVAVVLLLLGCGDSHNVTVKNECQDTVDVQIMAADGPTVNLNGIAPGQESGAVIGLGPMDVKAVFKKGGDEPTTGFKSEEGGSYKLTIRGNPPGIFLEVE